eukprot:142860-Chlamydomonas_euryale.AAC.1
MKQTHTHVGAMLAELCLDVSFLLRAGRGQLSSACRAVSREGAAQQRVPCAATSCPPSPQVFANIAIIVMDEEAPSGKDWFT